MKDVVHVPNFSKNLVSGIQIMHLGYSQLIDKNRLIISKYGKVVATGSYNSQEGLIQMDLHIVLNVSDSETERPSSAVILHNRFGHNGYQLLKNTLPAVNGIKLDHQMKLILILSIQLQELIQEERK